MIYSHIETFIGAPGGNQWSGNWNCGSPESMATTGYKINLFDSLFAFIFIQVDPISWLNGNEKEK